LEEAVPYHHRPIEFSTTPCYYSLSRVIAVSILSYFVIFHASSRIVAVFIARTISMRKLQLTNSVEHFLLYTIFLYNHSVYLLLGLEKVSMHFILEVFRDVVNGFDGLDLLISHNIPNHDDIILTDSDYLVLFIIAKNLHDLSWGCILNTGNFVAKEVEECDITIQTSENKYLLSFGIGDTCYRYLSTFDLHLASEDIIEKSLITRLTNEFLLMRMGWYTNEVIHEDSKFALKTAHYEPQSRKESLSEFSKWYSNVATSKGIEMYQSG